MEILKENTIVKNCNGYSYKVIKSNILKTLFQNTLNKEYVIGKYVKKYEDGIEWAYGTYYDNNFRDALKDFNN